MSKVYSISNKMCKVRGLCTAGTKSPIIYPRRTTRSKLVYSNKMCFSNDNSSFIFYITPIINYLQNYCRFYKALIFSYLQYLKFTIHKKYRTIVMKDFLLFAFLLQKYKPVVYIAPVKLTFRSVFVGRKNFIVIYGYDILQLQTVYIKVKKDSVFLFFQTSHLCFQSLFY